MRSLSLICWFALCFAVAALGARWTASEIPVWYRTLAQPSFAPPNWLFGPVWSLLYALMAIAAWQVWQSAPSSLRTWGLTLFMAQLALNLAWSWLFFRRHALGAAAVEVVILWAAIGITLVVFTASLPRLHG